MPHLLNHGGTLGRRKRGGDLGPLQNRLSHVHLNLAVRQQLGLDEAWGVREAQQGCACERQHA